ncbi:S8 family serine peptidase [Novosphingobium sp. KCTC 2891]|uniref:S8 family serine peptidase n=1 Tax=Novosphingobium sp. KCTC 2891 TaxID=2989730 RepID=UPI002221EC87|nr:S8 family serine peptidase [Novosphingobium sp. KCTC 2891]MCW1382544.1 S8 family serine peptidase [Novosphingobium sp. KCTC 2891]
MAGELPEEALAKLEQASFRVIERKDLAALGTRIIRLAAPRRLSTRAAVEQVRAEAPSATIDFDHYYGLRVAARSRPRKIKGAGEGQPPDPAGFPVGVIDTAVTAHPALGAARIVAWPRGARDGDATASGKDAQHGTAVASILAARGAATIYTANIFRGSAGRPFTSIDIVADALEWMLGNDVPVINMSLAGPRNAILDRLVAAAGLRGRMIVAAAGNSGPAAPPVFPAALPGVIAVTAVDRDGRIYRYANRGTYIAVAATGVDVTAAQAGGGVARFTGTSFATPVVSAILARCRARQGSPKDCAERLKASAHDLGKPGFDDTFGYGLVG